MGTTHFRSDIREADGSSITIEATTGEFSTITADTAVVAVASLTSAAVAVSVTSPALVLTASTGFKVSGPLVASAALSAATKMLRVVDVTTPATPVYYYIKVYPAS